MIRKYGKPSASWFKAKRWFFDHDKELLGECLRIADLYLEQPERRRCMVCDVEIEGAPSFVKHDIPYHVCPRCGHLNGAHQDSDAFCAGLYKEEESTLFSQMYSAEDAAAFAERRDTIYRPKADFLLDVLQQSEEDPSNLRFADFGAGSGYFVSALQQLGIKDIAGYEVSENQVRLGNAMLNGELLIHHELDEIEELISTVETDVISLVFVLEHIQQPRQILDAIRRNPHAKYVFIAVPMFSTSVFVEMAFPHFAQRHLTCGHTHLFTPQSVDWMCDEFGIERIAEWWFGADMIDFYRMIAMSLIVSPDSKNMVSAWEETFLPVVDQMQLELDKRHQSSELHFVARLKED